MNLLRDCSKGSFDLSRIHRVVVMQAFVGGRKFCQVCDVRRAAIANSNERAVELPGT